jgi:hypothetical protein
MPGFLVSFELMTVATAGRWRYAIVWTKPKFVPMGDSFRCFDRLHNEYRD